MANKLSFFQICTIWNTETAMTVKAILNAVIEYETPRYVKVQNPLVGLVLRWVNIIIMACFIFTIMSCRSSQTLIISYIVGWALIHERGYQEAALVESSFITKVKGTISSNIEAGEEKLYNR